MRARHARSYRPRAPCLHTLATRTSSTMSGSAGGARAVMLGVCSWLPTRSVDITRALDANSRGVPHDSPSGSAAERITSGPVDFTTPDTRRAESEEMKTRLPEAAR